MWKWLLDVAKLKKLGIFFLIILGVLFSMLHSNDSSKSDIPASYWFSYTMQESEQENNSLTIDFEGKVTGFIEFAEMNLSPRSLGIFTFSPGHNDPDLLEIGRLIKDNKMVGGDVYIQPPSFGGRSKFFEIKAGGYEVLHDMNPSLPMPDAFIAVETVVERLLERSEESPLRTLSMEINFDPQLVKSGDLLKIYIEFYNAGKLPTEFRNPISSSSSLRINLWRNVKDVKGELIHEFESVIDLAGKEFLFNKRQAVPTNKPFLLIQPGDRMGLFTTIRYPKSNPGIFFAEAIYYSNPKTNAEYERKDLIVGEYHTDLRQITIVKK